MQNSWVLEDVSNKALSDIFRGKCLTKSFPVQEAGEEKDAVSLLSLEEEDEDPLTPSSAAALRMQNKDRCSLAERRP